jgi:hypothetical protein
MLNYDKWKKLNENFMVSNSLGVTSRNGFLAYNPLNEKTEEEEIEVEEDEDMDDEDEDEDEDEDMEDEDMEDEDMDDEDEEMDDEDEEMDDEDEEMDDEDEEMQDETGEVEVVEDEDEDEDYDHDHHHDKMVVAKKCGYCGSYMKAESTTPEFDQWLESVRSIINPHVNEKLNGDILNEGAIPPQLRKYVMAKKKGKKHGDKAKKDKKGGCGCCDKCKCGETKMKVMDKKSPKMSYKKSPKMSYKKSSKMSHKKSPKMSWKKSPKK